MADKPSVAAGFCLIEVNAPLRISPTPIGRSGMPPGSCGWAPRSVARRGNSWRAGRRARAGLAVTRLAVAGLAVAGLAVARLAAANPGWP